MKKSFLAFCAAALLVGQPLAASAAATSNGEVEVKTYTITMEQFFAYIKWFTPQHIEMVKQEAAPTVAEKPASMESTNKVEEKEVIVKPMKPAVEKVPAPEAAKPVVEKVPAPETAKPAVEKVPAPEAAKPVEKEVPAAPVTQVTENPSQPTTAVQQTDVDQFEVAVVDLTNKEREKAGLAPLQMDKPLMQVAREKSQDMNNNNYFSHTSPTFGSPFDRLKAVGISYKAAGENIAKGQRTPEEVVTAWMNSAGHRANILDEKFTHIGVGFVKDGSIWTQQFIKK